MNRLSKDITEIIGKYIHQSLQKGVNKHLLDKMILVYSVVERMNEYSGLSKWMGSNGYVCDKFAILRCKRCGLWQCLHKVNLPYHSVLTTCTYCVRNESVK